MTDLDQAVVVLTGAAGGIGRATVERLRGRGARLIAVDRDEEGLAALARDHDVATHSADLRDVAAMPALAESLQALHGRVDVLVNNAGLTVQGLLRNMSAEEIDLVIDVDLRAPIHLTRALLPHLPRGAHVVFVSSMAGLHAFPTQSTYSAAKFGVRGFAEALRIEVAGDGIGVSTVLPGTIATPFLANAATHDRGTTDQLSRLMMRFGTPPDRVAKAIMDGIERNVATQRVGWDCYAQSAVSYLCPPLVPAILRRAVRSQWLSRD